MFTTIALFVVALLAVAVAIVLVLASRRPDTFSVQRSIGIKSPAETIFPLISDFHKWPVWSPWEKLDPNMVRTFSGAGSGRGAAYAWKGSSKVGAGRMEIKEAHVPSKVVIQLDFIKPFEGHNITEFTLAPRGDTTDVSWHMHGPAVLLSKVMGLFVSMDKMIGRDFETGLANMKAAAEK